MANASAKKAALAKSNTSSIYLPLIILINVVHLALLYILSPLISKKRILLTIIEWIGSYMAYQGILHDAEVGKLTHKKKAEISGGIYLDILGLIIVVQFGSIFIGAFINWFLLIVPICYTILKWFGKKKSDSDNSNTEVEQDDDLKRQLEERRRKRAERRKQKRG